MAKVIGPAHSVSASGTLAGSITFDKRGIAHTPNSPGNQQTAERGNARQIFLSMSHALQRCQASVRATIEAAAHPDRDWRAWLIKRAIGEQRSAWISTGLMWATFTEGDRDAWDAAASAAGFSTTAIAYATDDPISAGLAMFELANALYTAGIVTAPGTPGTANAITWATAITGSEPPPPEYHSLWSLDTTPATPDDGDWGPFELGTVFKSDVAGNVVGLRFYKSIQNTGTHTGHLWTAAGALIGTIIFTDETASGWQTAMFTSPITIEANTHYVISYSCPNSHYSRDADYFVAAYDAAPLHAPASEQAEGNGRYVGALNTFPWLSSSRANYYVDVLFQE
jgi:hypothetical protein